MRYMIPGCAFVVTGVLSGCMVGPHYKRPVTTAPAVYRDATTAVAPQHRTTTSMGDLEWSAVFKDEQLRALVAEALISNLDLKIAAQRVLEQEAQEGILKSQSLPSASGGGAYSAIGIPANSLGAGTASTFHGGGLTAAAAWNFDFWGLYRRQTEAGRANLLATEWGCRAVMSAVVSNVAVSYIRLRSFDAQLEIVQRNLNARRDLLRLIVLRESVGTVTMTNVHQAQQGLREVEVTLPAIERQIRQEENSLSLLLGRNPGPIARGARTPLLANLEEIPPGIPSELLERRPDIREAEAKMIAANARIGVAKAQFFPQISITGVGGTATSQFDKLLSTDSRYWFGAIGVSQPLFTGGKLKNNLRLAQETQKETQSAYRKSILSALRDVSDALIACRKARESRAAQESVAAEGREIRKLAQLRYDNGRTGYIEVLTSEEALLSAEMTLANYRQQEALSMVQLYSALGGGWK